MIADWSGISDATKELYRVDEGKARGPSKSKRRQGEDVLRAPLLDRDHLVHRRIADEWLGTDPSHVRPHPPIGRRVRGQRRYRGRARAVTAGTIGGIPWGSRAIFVRRPAAAAAPGMPCH